MRVSSATCSRQRAHGAVAARLVADVDRRRLAAFGATHRAADAAERVEIMIDRGDAELDGIEVLVGEIDRRQHVLAAASAAARAGRSRP